MPNPLSTDEVKAKIAAMEMAEYVYIMHEGQIKVEGTPQEIKNSPDLQKAYLGM